MGTTVTILSNTSSAVNCFPFAFWAVNAIETDLLTTSIVQHGDGVAVDDADDATGEVYFNVDRTG
jgi:hypothetical protein